MLRARLAPGTHSGTPRLLAPKWGHHPLSVPPDRVLGPRGRNGSAGQGEHARATQIPPKANLIGEKCWGSRPQLCRERADLWLPALTKEHSKAKLISLSSADERSSRSAKH